MNIHTLTILGRTVKVKSWEETSSDPDNPNVTVYKATAVGLEPQVAGRVSELDTVYSLVKILQSMLS